MYRMAPGTAPSLAALIRSPAYLESLFGAEVHGALDVLRTELDKKRRGQDSEVMDQLILYRWQDCLGHLSRDPAEIVWD